MIRGANVVLDVHVFIVLVPHVGVWLQAVRELLAGPVGLSAALRRALRVPGGLPVVLRFPQLLLVLHPSVLEPRFYLSGEEKRRKQDL